MGSAFIKSEFITLVKDLSTLHSHKLQQEVLDSMSSLVTKYRANANDFSRFMLEFKEDIQDAFQRCCKESSAESRQHDWARLEIIYGCLRTILSAK